VQLGVALGMAAATAAATARFSIAQWQGREDSGSSCPASPAVGLASFGRIVGFGVQSLSHGQLGSLRSAWRISRLQHLQVAAFAGCSNSAQRISRLQHLQVAATRRAAFGFAAAAALTSFRLGSFNRAVIDQ
jgi:hypothetical protein